MNKVFYEVRIMVMYWFYNYFYNPIDEKIDAILDKIDSLIHDVIYGYKWVLYYIWFYNILSLRKVAAKVFDRLSFEERKNFFHEAYHRKLVKQTVSILDRTKNLNERD